MADKFDRGQLLGYLLGALEDDEREAIDERLPHEPRLRRDLARTKASLRPLREVDGFLAPAGLAERTCRMVALLASPAPMESAAARSAPSRARTSRMSPEAASAGSAASWTWSDMAVAATVLVAVCLAVFPALCATRAHARMASCQEGLRQIGIGYAQFSQQFPRSLPNAPRPQAAAMQVSSSVNPYNPQPERLGRNILLDDGRVLLVRGGIPARPSYLSSLDQEEPPISARSMPPVVFVSGSVRE